eukprot:scaffold51248_cov68-Phaeocystis_antarctica.AAC.1
MNHPRAHTRTQNRNTQEKRRCEGYNSKVTAARAPKGVAAASAYGYGRPMCNDITRGAFIARPLPGFWTKHLASEDAGLRVSCRAGRPAELVLRVVVSDHGLGDDAVHRSPRGLHLRPPRWERYR